MVVIRRKITNFVCLKIPFLREGELAFAEV